MDLFIKSLWDFNFMRTAQEIRFHVKERLPFLFICSRYVFSPSLLRGLPLETFTFCVLESWKETLRLFEPLFLPDARQNLTAVPSMVAQPPALAPPFPPKTTIPATINGFLSSPCILQRYNTLRIQWLNGLLSWLECRYCENFFFADLFCVLWTDV